jgi:hypothetical protein
MAVWIVGGISATAEKAGESTAYAAGATIGVTLLFLMWLLVLAPLALVWFATRPKNNVVVYGPLGQQTMVSEKEAAKRVAKQGWTYQPVAKSDDLANRIGAVESQLSAQS